MRRFRLLKLESFQSEIKLRQEIFNPNQLTCQTYHRTVFLLSTRSWYHTLFLTLSRQKIIPNKYIVVYGWAHIDRWVCWICIWKNCRSSMTAIWIQQSFLRSLFQVSENSYCCIPMTCLRCWRNLFATLTANAMLGLVVVK